MKIIDLTGVASASFEITKSIQSLVFKSDLNLDALKDEQISLKVISGLNGKPLEITKGFVNFKRFLLSATSGQTLGSDKEFSLVSLINLTVGGFIPLDGTTVLRVELQNLNKKATYSFNSIQASYQTQRVHVYEAFNANKESVAYDFDVRPFDLLLLPVLSTVTELILTYSTGLQANITIQELKDLMSIANPPVYISADGLVQQHLEDYILFPINGISSIQIRKEKDSSCEMFLRLNVFN
jgi:hypothetical protein